MYTSVIGNVVTGEPRENPEKERGSLENFPFGIMVSKKINN